MENYPFAIFTFRKEVKTLKGHLKGKLKEEKDFFKQVGLPKSDTLEELVSSSSIIRELLRSFTRLKQPVSTRISIKNKDIYLEVSIYSEKPYSIILRLIPENSVAATVSREIINAIPTAIAILDNESNILDVNPQFEKLFGYKKEEITGVNINELIVPKDDIEDGIYLDNIVRDTGYFKVERTRIAKDGRMIPVIISGSSFSLDGKQIGFAVYEDIKDIKKVQEALYYQATHDMLTGLPNRYTLRELFHREKSNADTNGIKIALFFIDINRFKDINDIHGHDFGDRVIKKTAEILLSSLRNTDTVVRFGGDEFVSIFGNIKSKEDAIAISLKIIEAFSNPFVVDGITIDTGVNIGIVFYPNDGETLDELIRKADIAMYHAKATGTNNFVIYSKEIEEARFRTISDLKSRDLMFRLAFSKSPIPQIILDSEFKILKVNESFKNTFNINLKKIYLNRIDEIFEGFGKVVIALQNNEKANGQLSHAKIEGKDYNLKWTHSLIKSYSSVFYLLAILEVNSGSE